MIARVATATTALRAARVRQAAAVRRRRAIVAERGRTVRREVTAREGRVRVDRGRVGIGAAETARRADVRRSAAMNRAPCARPRRRS